MRAVHHTAIVTADVELSLRFWRDGLGLVEMLDHLHGRLADALRRPH